MVDIFHYPFPLYRLFFCPANRVWGHYIIVVDYTEQKKLAAEINKIGVNINTVCRRINSTGRFYQDDIDELKEKMDAVWQLLKSKQSEEL